jgi:hypothetical protein
MGEETMTGTLESKWKMITNSVCWKELKTSSESEENTDNEGSHFMAGNFQSQGLEMFFLVSERE